MGLEIWPTCFRIWIILISIMKLLLEKLKPGHLQNDKIEISQCKKRENTKYEMIKLSRLLKNLTDL